MRIPQLLLAFTAAALLSLTGAAAASANTLNVAPDAERAQTPCTAAQPCSLSFALDQAFDGDEVVLAPGTYDHHGGDPLAVRPGVEVRGTPGRTRPLIEQTVPYRDCDGCRILHLNLGAELRDVDVTQAVEGGGAVEATAGSTIERSALRARSNALHLVGNPVAAPSGGVREVLAVASQGTAILSERGQTAVKYLENVTAIGQGPVGTGIRVVAEADSDDTLDAVNTIARGSAYDIDVTAKPWGSPQGANIDDVATMNMRYGNFRGDRTRVEGSDPAWPNARFEGFDRNVSDDPQFVSATDFRLKQGSPAIDKGRRNGLFGALDLDGLGRSYGAAPDMGAYEWRPAPKPPESNPGDDETTPPGPDPVPPPPKPFLGLDLAKQAVAVKRNVAAIKVKCPAAPLGPCAGTLRLRSGRAIVGSRRFSVARGGTAVVKVKLNKKGRKLIARKRKLTTQATATTYDTFGKSVETKTRVKLKLASKRRR